MFDVYGFIGPWPYWKISHKTPESILGLMEKYQIETLAICSTRSIFWDWREGNEETIAVSQKFPTRFAAFVSVSPVLPVRELVAHLRDYKRRNVKGIRLYPQHHFYSLTLSSEITKVLKTAEEIDLPVVLPIRTVMLWGLPELETPAIEETVSRHPELSIILSGVNYSEALWAFDLMHRFSHVYLEISGLQSFRAVDEAARAAGANRILFGSGLPLQYPSCSVQKVQVAKINQQQKHAINEGNARSLLGI